MSDLGTYIARKTANAILRFGMIAEGDRILVALSGGKDSTALFHTLINMQPNFTHSFEVEAMHIHTEYCTCKDDPRLWDLIDAWGGTVNIKDVSIKDRLKPGRAMNCYWCSTQRRTELMKFAEENQFNKIALGHHMDDIVETFFMNMAYKSELSTMLPVMRYDRYPHVVIRPLSLIKERFLADFAQEIGLAGIACSCDFDTKSKRRVVRQVIEQLARDGEYIKDNIFEATGNPNLRYLMTAEAMPDMKTRGEWVDGSALTP